MISESLVHLGEKKSGIRELFEYGLRQGSRRRKEKSMTIRSATLRTRAGGGRLHHPRASGG